MFSLLLGFLPFALAAPVLQAPLQAPLHRPLTHPDTLHIPSAAVEPHIKPEVLKAGFSSRGRGIPVLHDLCSGHDLVRSLNAGEAAVYVYHERRWGFCVSLFAPETPVTVSVTTPHASSSAPAQAAASDAPKELEDKERGYVPRIETYLGDHEAEYDSYEIGGEDAQGAEAGNAIGATRKDEASWTGRGSMPGSLRLRSNDNCLRILAEVSGVQSDMEVCLGYS